MQRSVLRLPIIAAVFAALSLLLVGCRTMPNATSNGALSIPSEGKVRVISRKIVQGPDKLHWKWSLIGERNWTTAEATETSIGLSKTYPLNDTAHTGGCNIWECDLTAERITDSKTGQTVIRWTNVLHGSDGTTRTGTGTLSADQTGDADKIVRIQIDQDTLLKLPAETTLARVGDKDITLHVAL
jgi:hypothetical protein